MEKLRRGGLAYMQTWQPGADAPVPVLVKWFRMAPTARVYTDWTTFRSSFFSNYEAQRIEDCECGCFDRRNAPHSGVGMQSPFELDDCGCPVYYPYANNTAPAPFVGLVPCGTAEVARNGGRFGIDPAFLIPANLVPECCPDVNLLASSGDVDGGSAVQGSMPGLGGIGGDEDGGSAFVNTDCFLWFGYACPSEGGDEDGGTAPQEGLPGWPASGGDADGGVAVALGGYVWAAAGGDVDGGIAAQIGGYLLAAVGGDVDGGVAVQWGGYLLDGQGGDEDGGTADQWGPPAWHDGTMVGFDTTSPATVTIPLVSDGDLVLLFVVGTGTTDVSTPPDWTLVTSGDDPFFDPDFWLFSHTHAPSDPPTVDLTWTGSGGVSFGVVTVSNPGPVTPGTFEISDVMVVTPPAVTDIPPDSLVLLFFISVSAVGLDVPPDWMTLGASDTDPLLALTYYAEDFMDGDTPDTTLEITDGVEWVAGFVVVAPIFPITPPPP